MDDDLRQSARDYYEVSGENARIIQIVGASSPSFEDRFANLAAQLGEPRATRRLGSVYALARLADEWDAGRQNCIDVLCDYMRMPSESASDATASIREQQVRHTIMNTIGDRLRQKPVLGKTWHTCEFNFRGAAIDGGNLRSADFSYGTFDFRSVTFCDGRIVFNGSVFSKGKVLFGGAKFESGSVDFTDVQFCGAEVSFFGARFRGSSVNFNAKFTDGVVTFRGAVFSGGTVCYSANFAGGTVDFSRAQFKGGTAAFVAKFVGTKVDFRGAKFSGGNVKLASPQIFDVPPVFDEFPNGMPRGLQLPSV